jgi:hypothetical protein
VPELSELKIVELLDKGWVLAGNWGSSAPFTLFDHNGASTTWTCVVPVLTVERLLQKSLLVPPEKPKDTVHYKRSELAYGGS